MFREKDQERGLQKGKTPKRCKDSPSPHDDHTPWEGYLSKGRERGRLPSSRDGRYIAKKGKEGREGNVRERNFH